MKFSSYSFFVNVYIYILSYLFFSMAKVLIVYGTTSGNTEWVVTNVAKSLTAAGLEVTTERCEMSEPSSIPNYDVVLLASPTYNVGKLQENFDEYYKKFITNKFDGKKFACIALGDSKLYDIFGGAKDFLEKGVKEVGGVQILPTLMIDGMVYGRETEWETWGTALGKVINGNT